MNLHSRLDVLLNLYESKGLDVASGLRPPATDDELAAAEALLGVALPDEVRALWTWHNGWDEQEGDAPFWFGDIFLGGTPEVVELKAILSYYEATPSDGFDVTCCVPFARHDGQMLVVTTGSQTIVAGHAHPVIEIYDDFYPAFHSVTTMVETAIAWASETSYDHYIGDQPWRQTHRDRLNPDLPL